MKNVLLLFFTIIVCLPTYPAKADCGMRDLIYSSGEYELTFYHTDVAGKYGEAGGTLPATEFPFKITNIKDNISFEGSIGYGNGYSTPRVGIDLCADKGREYRKKYKNFCGYSGTVYEIDGLGTKYAFQTTGDSKNPILFPDLNLKFYHTRNGFGESWAASDIPKDIWIFKGCKK